MVVNQVVGKFGQADPAPIKIDDLVLFDEDISTGKAAKTIIRFRDGSTFAMGPDSVVRIDKFVFNPDESVSHKTVTVTQGVFRYISGFAAKDQSTDIKVTSGTMSIRGSVVSGVVSGDAPPLLFVGQGIATFSNGAGTTDVNAGQGIAVPSPTTAPINPANLPPAIIAQALAIIEPLLPPPQVQVSVPPPNPQVLAHQGQLNLVSAGTQQAQQNGNTGAPAGARSNTGTASLAKALTLLQQAKTVGLLDGSQTGQTPQQQAFLQQVNQAANQAMAQLNAAQSSAGAAHATNATNATIQVAQGLSGAGTNQPSTQTAGIPGTAQGGTGTPQGGLAGAVARALGTGNGVGPGGTTFPTATPQGVQSALTAPGTNVTPTVISLSEANPSIAEAALRTALNILGAGTGAAASMITSFAQDIGDVADCDIDAGQQMAQALEEVLQDPGFSTLGVNNPNAVSLAQSTADSFGVTTFTPAAATTAAATNPTTLTSTVAQPTTTTVTANPAPSPPPPSSFGTFGATTTPTPTTESGTTPTSTGAPTSPAA